MTIPLSQCKTCGARVVAQVLDYRTSRRYCASCFPRPIPNEAAAHLLLAAKMDVIYKRTGSLDSYPLEHRLADLKQWAEEYGEPQ
jgi:hypothetical protein